MNGAGAVNRARAVAQATPTNRQYGNPTVPVKQIEGGGVIHRETFKPYGNPGNANANAGGKCPGNVMGQLVV